MVESLIKSNNILKIEVTELKKITSGNTKTIQTAANKVSELKTTVENLNKRLAKFEAKNDTPNRLRLLFTNLNSHLIQMAT